MISIETSFYTWKKSSETPLWATETVWLNPDYVVSIEVRYRNFDPDVFRGTDVDKFTKVHTTNGRYLTTEPADKLAKRIRNYPESKFTYSEAINPKLKGIFKE